MKAEDRLFFGHRSLPVTRGRLSRANNFKIHPIGIFKLDYLFAKAFCGRFDGDVVFLEALGPEVDCTSRCGEACRCHLWSTNAPAMAPSPCKKCHDASRTAELVTIVQVVTFGIIEIHRKLH